MFNLDPGDPEVLWLNITNISLGIVTLLCFAAVAWGVIAEVAARLRSRVSAAVQVDDHAFAVPGLGLTMADGGKKVGEEPKK